MGSTSTDKSSEDDKRRTKTLLIDAITKECASSSHGILQRIHIAIDTSNNDGSKLEATILSGGSTNFAYKVFVDKHPDLRIFAKLCFEYAMWNPDRSAHYDLQRTVNEYHIMMTSSEKSPDNVVKPLALLDLKQDDQSMKCLVTEWSNADEQFCNQLIDGSVDPRIAPKLATTFAQLHSITGFDPSFNETVKPCMESMMHDLMRPAAVEASKNTNPTDRTEAYCSSMGEEVITNIMDECISDYDNKGCLIHSDAHAFNILVEAKPSIERLDEFGPDGLVILCDWEMAMAGPIGKDMGLSLSFPIACMVAHALNGHTEANESISAHINSLIDTYLSCMKEAGKKTPNEMASILRNIAGWCGWFQYMALYVQRVFDTFPVDDDVNKCRVQDAMGILGLKLMRLAYDTDYVPAPADVNEIREVFDSLLEDEVTRAQYAFARGKSKRKPRTSSILRTSNHRLSDTTLLYMSAESVRWLSIAAKEASSVRKDDTANKSSALLQ